MMDACIFDIDGTLLRIPHSGRFAYENAITETFGEKIEIDPKLFAGTTDFKLLKELLGVDSITDEDRASFSMHLRTQLEKAIAGESAIIFPGVREILKILSDAPNVTLGIGTGNIASTAKLKLEHADLPPVFSFGGYGDDSEMRHEIIRIALDRAAAQLGSAPNRVVYVGDTPFDIHAAKEAGVRVIAVATGRYSKADLLSHQPDVCFENLKDVRNVIESMNLNLQ